MRHSNPPPPFNLVYHQHDFHVDHWTCWHNDNELKYNYCSNSWPAKDNGPTPCLGRQLRFITGSDPVHLPRVTKEVAADSREAKDYLKTQSSPLDPPPQQQPKQSSAPVRLPGLPGPRYVIRMPTHTRVHKNTQKHVRERTHKLTYSLTLPFSRCQYAYFSILVAMIISINTIHFWTSKA